MKYKFIYGIAFLFCASIQAQSLLEFQAMATENNPGLMASYKKFEASLEQIPQAKSLEDPMLSAGYFLQPMGTLMGEQVFRLSLSQQFPWFGTLKAKGDVLALQSEANFQNFIHQKALVERQVAEAFYPLIEIEALLQLEKERLDLLHSIYEVAENQYENNTLSLKGIFQLDMEIEESKTNVSLLQQRKKRSVAQLNALVNRKTEMPVEVVAEEDASKLSSSSVSVEGHPLLEGLQLQEKSFEAQEKLVQKSAMPKLGIGLEYMYLDDFTMNGVSYEGMNMFMPMLSVSLPIFNKKYKSARREAKFMQEASKMDYKNELNVLTASFYQQQATIEGEQERLALLEFKVNKTQQILDLSFNEFENSLGSLADLLGVQQKLIQFQQEKEVTLTNLRIAEAQMRYLTYK
jgi:outer membrane protein TolC